MRRIVRPEILDHLPPDDPAAVRSRRDLRLINAIMGNHRWIKSRLATSLQPGDHIVEIGAGDATLADRLLPLVNARGARLSALDQAPKPHNWPPDPACQWQCGDLRNSSLLLEATVLVANLVLHHFTDQNLAEMNAQWLGTRVILASEPLRARPWMRFALYPFGLHAVTRHDMAVSIRAGFRGDELSKAMGLTTPHWQTREHGTLFGAHRLEARRTE